MSTNCVGIRGLMLNLQRNVFFDEQPVETMLRGEVNGRRS